ncbi:Glutathione S-transferase GST-4.5 [Granulosicoccus antarcticus IMCC3135]|uniref:Glutathione S-transferase GST-4.5 n=2 Tax=Granulosicoccus TaxID=437504 RepID=A0A2Z2NWW5_9GAMM|nr:Glutathione S-transferase GST-4.5 [Granulosicoccus antarcticus IMCC3135]
MLNLCSADWQPVFVDFFNGETRTDAYLELNDMGEVPTLEAKNVTLTQSGVILDYLADAFEQFDANSVPEHREVLRWILFDNNKLTGSIAPLRFMREFTDQGENEVTAFLHARAAAALKILDTRVAKSDFIVGEEPTIADISLCGYLFWPEETGIDMNDYPAVTAWLERIQALSGWEHPYELMPGHPRENG